MIGPWVVEVRRCCEEFLAKGRRLALDLANVSFVDRDGIVLLQELVGRRVALVNCSPFLVEQLKEFQHDDR
jgi:ABC-type transporter Mla MlaB component